MPNNKKTKKESSSAVEITDDVKKLVKARLGTLPRGIGVSVGSEGEFSRDELIEHVEREDDIGRKMIEIDMEFLQSLKKGEFYEQNTFDYQT